MIQICSTLNWKLPFVIDHGYRQANAQYGRLFYIEKCNIEKAKKTAGYLTNVLLQPIF